MVITWSFRVPGLGCIGNVVEGNYIGTDATGTYSLSNPAAESTRGIYTDSDADTVIGGTTPGSGNLISGNPGQSPLN